MHIFFAEGWTDETFIREHARAVARYCSVSSVLIEYQKDLSVFPFRLDITHTVDEGVQVYKAVIHSPVRRFGIYDSLIRRTYRKVLKKAIEKSGPVDLV